MEYLSRDLDAPVTGSLDDFVVGIGDRGRVTDITEMLNHSDAVFGPIDPRIVLRIKEPFMDTATRDGHIGVHSCRVSVIGILLACIGKPQEFLEPVRSPLPLHGEHAVLLTMPILPCMARPAILYAPLTKVWG